MTLGDPGWFSEESLRERASVVADVEAWAWGNLGEIMHGLLNPEPEPGPPYTHTIVPPEPIGWDEDGTPLYPEPGPSATLNGEGTRRSAPVLLDMDEDRCPGCGELIADVPAGHSWAVSLETGAWSCRDIDPEPGPAVTLTERPLADVVAEAGSRPPAQRIEITADFCQCPACREGRCETVQPERTGCYWPIEDAPA